jgi:hypothetical protein
MLKEITGVNEYMFSCDNGEERFDIYLDVKEPSFIEKFNIRKIIL